MEITGTFEIAKLTLHEGDTLVVKTDLYLTKEQCSFIRESMAQYVPDGVKLLVVTGDMTLSVLKAADD